MGRLIYNLDVLSIFARESVLQFNCRTEDVRILRLPETPISVEEHVGEENVDDSCLKSNGDEIVTMCLASDNGHLACATASKKLYIWHVDNSQLLVTRQLIKRPVSLSFSVDSTSIIVADKTGDVYKFCLQEISHPEESKSKLTSELNDENNVGPKPILGHLSMLLDMIISADGKFIMTCDRDEKIRISHFPNSYNIQSFCLGHKEFVSRILEIPSCPNLVISGSGDCTIKLWNYKTGKCLASVDMTQHHNRPSQEKQNNKDKLISSPESITGIESMMLDGSKDELFLNAVVDMAVIGGVDCLLAVSVNGSKSVLIYTVTTTEIIHRTTIEMECLPVASIFISDSKLLVLKEESESLPKGRQPFMIYKINRDGGESFSAENVESHPILNFGEKHYDVLQDAGKSLLDVKLMEKHQYDNLSDYLKLKEERKIEGGVKKIKKC